MDITYTEWGPTAAVMTVQWWWRRAEASHADQSDWRTRRWRCRLKLRSALAESSWSRSWWNNCAGFWWNSTGFLFQWSWRREEKVWTYTSTKPKPVKSSELCFAALHIEYKNSQCEAQNEAVLPDNSSATQLQNWKVRWSTVFSICWIQFCRQKKRIKNIWKGFNSSPNLQRLSDKVKFSRG